MTFYLPFLEIGVILYPYWSESGVIEQEIGTETLRYRFTD